MKKRLGKIPAIPLFLIIGVFATSSALAVPSIQYVSDSTVPTFGTVLHYSNLSEWDFPHEVPGSVNTLNGTTQLLFSGDTAQNSNVPYSNAVLYTEAISDGSATNGRGGLINGGLFGGWGALKIRGYVKSSRTGDPVRSYAEATADAYLAFQIDDPGKVAGLDKVRVRFRIDTDLWYWRNRDPSLSNVDDRYVNWATFGGLVQSERPLTNMNFNLSTAPLNNSSPLFVLDEHGNYVNLNFDDPARPEQYDAIDPDVIVDLDRTVDPPQSGRGGPIPEPTDVNGDVLGTNRTSLGSAGDDITLAMLQERLLQDTDSSNPANNADAWNPQYSVGNATFNVGPKAGMGYHEWYFNAVVGHEYVIYTQLSANITDDGGIDGKFGSSSNVEDFATLYYSLDIIPEPGTIIMIGLAMIGGTAFVRMRMKK